LKKTPNSDKDLLVRKKLATTIIASIIIAKLSDDMIAAS
jgi:hypothetical protein